MCLDHLFFGNISVILNSGLKTSSSNTATGIVETNTQSVMQDEVDLCTLGGIIDSEKCTNIAEALLSKDEFKHIGIERKRKPQQHQPVDAEHMELYRRACKICGRTVFSTAVEVHFKVSESKGVQRQRKIGERGRTPVSCTKHRIQFKKIFNLKPLKTYQSVIVRQQ